MVDFVWVWVSVGLMVANVATAAVLGWALFLRHSHDWLEWSDWIMDYNVWSYHCDVQAIRYRVCDGCARVDRQTAGWHRCTVDGKAAKCPHLAGMISNSRQTRIKRLERDLGLDP